MDQLFRQSGLYRAKWDERDCSDGRTYGQATIQTAIGGAREFYNGSNGARPSMNGNRPTTAMNDTLSVIQVNDRQSGTFQPTRWLRSR